MLSSRVYVLGEEVIRSVLDRIQDAIRENQRILKIMSEASTSLLDATQKQNVVLVDLMSEVRSLLTQAQPDPQVEAAIAAIDAATDSMKALDVEVESQLNPVPPPPAP